MNNPTLALRLHQTVAAAAPIDGVSVLDPVAHVARIDYQPGATTAQRAAAAAALAAFDWSAAADTAWQLTQDRSTALTHFLTDTSASAKVLRAVALVLLDRVNAIESELQTLRNAVRVVAPTVPAVTYPQFTAADVKAAVQAKINGGAAD